MNIKGKIIRIFKKSINFRNFTFLSKIVKKLLPNFLKKDAIRLLFNKNYYFFWNEIGKFLKRENEKLFPFWEKFGFHITRNHFYQPIPDTRTLKDDLWEKRSELIGIDVNEEDQFTLLSLFSSKFKREYEKFPKERTSVPYQYYINNDGFEDILIGAYRRNDSAGNYQGETYLFYGCNITDDINCLYFDMNVSEANASFYGEDGDD